MISMSFLAFACRSLAALSLIHFPSRMLTAGGHRMYAANRGFCSDRRYLGTSARTESSMHPDERSADSCVSVTFGPHRLPLVDFSNHE
jgi:hypothetical protein